VNLAWFVLAAAVTVAPLKPVATVGLSAHGSVGADVAWLSDDELLVALTKGGVVRVSARTRATKLWLPEGPLPGGAPYAELIATDGDVVVVMGGGRRNVAFRKPDGTYLYGFLGGRLNPRGLAVTGRKAFFTGWVTRMGTDEDQQRGALWTQTSGEELSERPVHRVLSSPDALARWRLTMHPYGGAAVALPDGSVAVITSAEPGIFRYDRDGKLLEVLGSGISELLLDSPRLARNFGTDVAGRYREVLNRQRTIEDLVVTPAGIAILVRVARGDKLQWQLWTPGRSAVDRIQELEPAANGPIGHMKCEARGKQLACITNMPDAKQAAEPGPAGSNPTLLLYAFGR